MLPLTFTVRIFAVMTPALIIAGLSSDLWGGVNSSAISQPGQVFSQPRLMRQVVRELTREASDVRAKGLPPDAAPDFADRYEGGLTIETIQQALITPQHRDPFVDAYIRWQLLSFDPSFPELDDRAFLRLLSGLPALIENPRGEPRFMELVERAESLDSLAPSDFEQLQRLDAERTQRMHFAESLNQPAMALRQWIRTGVEDSILRTLQTLLEECAATIDGAWPPRHVKTALTSHFTRGASELSIDEKRALAEQARGLAGRERRFVNRITFFADRSINVSYSRARATQAEYDRWMQRLAGNE